MRATLEVPIRVLYESSAPTETHLIRLLSVGARRPPSLVSPAPRLLYAIPQFIGFASDSLISGPHVASKSSIQLNPTMIVCAARRAFKQSGDAYGSLRPTRRPTNRRPSRVPSRARCRRCPDFLDGRLYEQLAPTLRARCARVAVAIPGGEAVAVGRARSGCGPRKLRGRGSNPPRARPACGILRHRGCRPCGGKTERTRRRSR